MLRYTLFLQYRVPKMSVQTNTIPCFKVIQIGILRYSICKDLVVHLSGLPEINYLCTFWRHFSHTAKDPLNMLSLSLASCLQYFFRNILILPFIILLLVLSSLYFVIWNGRTLLPSLLKIR